MIVFLYFEFQFYFQSFNIIVFYFFKFKIILFLFFQSINILMFIFCIKFFFGLCSTSCYFFFVYEEIFSPSVNDKILNCFFLDLVWKIFFIIKNPFFTREKF